MLHFLQYVNPPYINIFGFLLGCFKTFNMFTILKLFFFSFKNLQCIFNLDNVTRSQSSKIIFSPIFYLYGVIFIFSNFPLNKLVFIPMERLVRPEKTIKQLWLDFQVPCPLRGLIFRPRLKKLYDKTHQKTSHNFYIFFNMSTIFILTFLVFFLGASKTFNMFTILILSFFSFLKIFSVSSILTMLLNLNQAK